MFWHSSNRGFLFASPGGLLANGNLLAQQPGASTESDLAALYSRGMSEFQNGDYARAASVLEGFSAKAEFAPTLEPVFFTPGLRLFVVRFGKQSSRRKLNDQRSGAVSIRRSLQRQNGFFRLS